MKILGIETSCDETSLSIIEAKGGIRYPKFKVFENLVSSQIKIHAPYGGVVPHLAKREHSKNLPLLTERLKQKGYELEKVDFIAVTIGPGLEPALWSGINFAKETASKYKKKVIGVNHLEGHIISFLLPSLYKTKKQFHISFLKIFPAVQLLASGGHTILILMKSITDYKKLGETRDDAAGEAFDKVGRLLGLTYPAGPEIEKLAKKGRPKIEFPRPMIHQKNYDFSFSGLKTAVLYYLREHKNIKKADIAASFQEACLEVLVKKTVRAVKELKAKSIIISGGVAANSSLRHKMKNEAKAMKINFFAPDFIYNTDNAAMIAASGYINLLQNKKRRLIARGDLNI